MQIRALVSLNRSLLAGVLRRCLRGTSQGLGAQCRQKGAVGVVGALRAVAGGGEVSRAPRCQGSAGGIADVPPAVRERP